MKRFLLFFVLSSLCFGANKAEIVHSGNQATKDLMQSLSTALQSKIEEGGLSNAVEFCSKEAQKITDSINAKYPDIKIKRVSLDVRNPQNSPDASEKKVVELFNTLKENNLEMTPFIQKVTETNYRFYKPIILNREVCLKCHGSDSDLDKGVKPLLTKLYPNDRAINYKLGDIRGAFVVDVKVK